MLIPTRSANGKPLDLYRFIRLYRLSRKTFKLLFHGRLERSERLKVLDKRMQCQCALFFGGQHACWFTGVNDEQSRINTYIYIYIDHYTSKCDKQYCNSYTSSRLFHRWSVISTWPKMLRVERYLAGPWTDPETPNFHEVKVIEKCSETELKVVEPRLVPELSADRLEMVWTFQTQGLKFGK